MFDLIQVEFELLGLPLGISNLYRLFVVIVAVVRIRKRIASRLLS